MEKKSLTQLLESNPYPGRGIVLGRDNAGTHAVAAYFIMGRSTGLSCTIPSGRWAAAW